MKLFKTVFTFQLNKNDDMHHANNTNRRGEKSTFELYN